MLTHQLACINISFSIHISSHSIQANLHGQFRSNKQIWTVFNSPKPVCGLSKDDPPHQASVPLLGTKIHGHFRPHNTQNYFHGFLDKEYPSRRRPLPPGVSETPQYRHLRVALAVGINFASCVKPGKILIF